VSKELNSSLLLLLSNNATEEELVGVQDNRDADAELYRAFLCLRKAYTQGHYTFTMQGFEDKIIRGAR
jgi:hypothetical protein